MCLCGWLLCLHVVYNAWRHFHMCVVLCVWMYVPCQPSAGSVACVCMSVGTGEEARRAELVLCIPAFPYPFFVWWVHLLKRPASAPGGVALDGVSFFCKVLTLCLSTAASVRVVAYVAATCVTTRVTHVAHCLPCLFNQPKPQG